MYSEQDGSNRQQPVNSGERTALYAAISPRTIVTATRPSGLWLFAVTTGEGACVIGLKAGKGRIEHFTSRHNDDVESRGRFQSSEQLAGETLGPVPHHRGSKLPGSRHAQSAPCASVWCHKQRHEPAAQTLAVLIGPFEIRTSSNPLEPGQALRHRALAGVTVRRKRSGAFAPSSGGVSARYGRSLSTSARGSRASCCGDACWAETCAYPLPL